MRYATIALAGLVLNAVGAARTPVGMFSEDRDIGTVTQPGSARVVAGAYTVVGNGDDLWAAKDDFHFVSRPVSGDMAVSGTIGPASGSTEPHSKAGLMIRTDLTPGSPYADIVVHQNGLVALQYRAAPGGITQEIAEPPVGPGRYRIARRGGFVTAYAADADGHWHQLGGAVAVSLGRRAHAGLFVCSHSDTQTRTVTFTQVSVGRP